MSKMAEQVAREFFNEELQDYAEKALDEMVHRAYKVIKERAYMRRWFGTRTEIVWPPMDEVLND